MMKVLIGFVAGAGLVYSFLVYPVQSKQIVRQGVDATTSAIAQGAQAAQHAANEQLAKNGK